MNRNGASRQEKVLVYLFGSLGDTIVAIPALRAVRRHFRDAELVLLQNVASGNIVQASEVIPEVFIDRNLSYKSHSGPLGKLAGFFNLWRDLRKERFDAVVYLVISERPERSVSRDRMFFRMCGIRKLIGFHAFSSDELYPVDAFDRPAMTEHEAIRKLNRLELGGIDVRADEDLRQPLFTFSVVELEKARKWLNSNRRKPLSQLIAIAPGCKTKSNEWPVENFLEIGRRLIAKDCEVLIVGGKDEIGIARLMTDHWGEGIAAAGEFSVKESAALLSLCDAYVGLDTGTTHLAAAAGVPCFGIYGERNNPGHWYPLGTGHSVIFHRVDCAGCRLFECPKPDHPCMTGLSADTVWASLSQFVARPNRLG